MKKQNKGITLITLIITIIVLLILAGVTINMVLGENGLFGKAKTSVAKHENAQKNENTALTEYETEIDNARETITITKEDLNNLIDEKIKAKDVTSEYSIVYNTSVIDTTKNSNCTIIRSGNTINLTIWLYTSNNINRSSRTELISGLPRPKMVCNFTGIVDGAFKQRIELKNDGVLNSCFDVAGTISAGSLIYGTFTYIVDE